VMYVNLKKTPRLHLSVGRAWTAFVNSRPCKHTIWHFATICQRPSDLLL